LARLGVLLLQLPSEAAVAGADLIDVGVPWASRVVQQFPIRGGRQRDHSQVYAQEVLRLGRGRFWRVHRAGQEERAVAIQQVCLPADAIKSSLLVGPEAEADFYAPVHGQQRGAIYPGEAQHTLVVGHSSVWPEGGAGAAIPLVGFGHLRTCADAHLGRETELLPEGVVHQLLQFNLVGHAMRECRARDVVAGGVEGFERPQERSGLFRQGSQLDEQRLFHTDSLPRMSLVVNSCFRELGAHSSAGVDTPRLPAPSFVRDGLGPWARQPVRAPDSPPGWATATVVAPLLVGVTPRWIGLAPSRVDIGQGGMTNHLDNPPLPTFPML